MTEQQQIESTIAGLEAQRGVPGDELTNRALAPLRAKLAVLLTSAPAPTVAQALTLGQSL